MYELSTHDSIRAFEPEEWSALVGDGAPPFLSWTWLDALERAGCVRPERGWLPMHVAIRTASEDDPQGTGELVAVAPAYVKGHSQGEFVFDHSWAQFCEGRLRTDYYPKLIVAVPFTPATGARLLVARGADRRAVTRAFAGGLGQLCEAANLSSAHVLFPMPTQAEELAEAGMAHRNGVQYHWNNPGYSDFADFLGRFNSKRRNQIKRERRALTEQGTRIEVVTGSDIDEEAVELAFEFYVSTVQKYYWGRQYLNRGFFRDVCERMPEGIQIVIARDAGTGRALGGAFNLVGGGGLYGRYWGCHEERPHLHFNVCYYAGIEEAIRQGLRVFEPGAGGEHKLARGFEPTVTHSTHVLRHPVLDRAVREFVAEERAAIHRHIDCEPSVLKPR